MRYLFITFDGGGNLPPELALARRLSDRGHEVRFLGHRSQRAAVEEAGFAFSCYEHAPDHDSTERDATPIKDWTGEEPSKVFASIREHLIFGPAALFAADVTAELERHPADALAVDFFLFGALAAAEKSGLPAAVLWHTVHAPGNWWKQGLPMLNTVRAEIGLAPVNDVFEQYRRLDRVLVLTSRAFDFAIPETELPVNVRHVGPQLAMPQEANGTAGGSDQPPLVLVSFSTTYQAQEDLLRRVVQALGTLPVRALVTTGPAVALESELPENVEVSAWIPHADVLPHAALVVTHAGLGTVMAGLAHGVPLLCLPMGRDQHGNAARVTQLGAGLVLPADADIAQIADGVHTALADPTLIQNARRIAITIREDIAANEAVIELETLAKGADMPAEQTVTADGSAPYVTAADRHAASTPQDVVRAYFAALNSSDLDALVALFADDAAVLADDYPTATGSDQIRAVFEGAFAATRMQRDVHIERVLEADDLAIVRAHSTGTVTMLEPGTTTEEANRELYALQRTHKGWRITDYMLNSPAAAEH